MNKKEFYNLIEKGSLEGACRYFEYWFIVNSLPKEAKILEIGAGMSALSSVLLGMGYDVYATDADSKRVKYQQSQGVNCSKVDSDYLPFEDESFDVVISASAIEHFEDDRKMASEIKRVLVNSGTFIMTLPTGTETIENRYFGTTHPKEKIYSIKEYEDVFLNGLEEIKRSMYRMSDKRDFDFEPHKGWGNKLSAVKVKDIRDNTGLCVVLKKI